MLKIRAFIGVVMVFLLATGVAAGGCTAGRPAGTVLYTHTDQGVFLLLADHRPPSTRGWGSFGGKHELGENPAQTAARETEEETRGYFHRGVILAAIGNQQPVYDGRFAQFFVEVGHVLPEAIAEAVLPSNDFVYNERGPWAWVPYAEIQRLIEMDDSGDPLRIDARYLPAGAHTDWIWPTFLHSLLVAIEQGALPWETTTEETAAAGF
ncbi:MAG: NUDIX domain-containing protein [Desulfobacterales bacterium]|nr:NUDIX domain-containing protein [Desulfobacterales bacterium]